MKPATDSSLLDWTLRSEHSGAFLRLQRMLNGRESFTLCFLTFSDSVYRDEVADFLEGRLKAHVRVAIDPEERIGTETLFDRLAADPDSDPAQFMGLESWSEGLDDLLGRLNQRREALAERCPRPLLFWVLSSHLTAVATRAADLWAWRSGVFDFTLPPTGVRTDRASSPPRWSGDVRTRSPRAYREIAEVPGETFSCRPGRRGPVGRSGRPAEVARRHGRSGIGLFARVGNSRKAGRSETTRHHLRQNRRYPPRARPTRRSPTDPDRRTTARLRETRRRPPAGHHTSQNRRHPPDARAARRSPAHPNRRTTARLREARRHPLQRHHPEQNRRHPPGTRTTRRGSKYPHRDASNCPSSKNSATPAQRRARHLYRQDTARVRRTRRHPLVQPSRRAESPTSSRNADNSTKRSEFETNKCCRSTRNSGTSVCAPSRRAEIADILQDTRTTRRSAQNSKRTRTASLREARRRKQSRQNPTQDR